MPLSSRAKVKLNLGIPAGTTRHDAVIDDIILDVDREIIGFMGIAAITVNTYDEAHDILEVTDEIRLRQWPVVSVAAVTESSSALVEGTDFYVDNDVGYIRLLRSGRFFDRGRQKVSVRYDAGRDPIPDDIIRAHKIWSCAHFNTDRHEGFKQENQGTYIYKTADSQELLMPSRVFQILQRYIRIIH